MATLARRKERSANTWPGFVDAFVRPFDGSNVPALSVVFVIAQFFLDQAISGQDQELKTSSLRLEELANVLSLERQSNKDLQANLNAIVGRIAGIHPVSRYPKHRSSRRDRSHRDTKRPGGEPIRRNRLPWP